MLRRLDEPNCRNSWPLSSCFCSRTSATRSSRVLCSRRPTRGPVIRLTQELIDLPFLCDTRVGRPAEAAVIAETGLAHYERRQPGGHRKVAALVRTTRTASDIAGAEDDLFGGSAGQDRSQTLHHGAACEHFSIRRDGGDEPQGAIESRNDRGEDEVPALIRAEELRHRVAGFVHGYAPHLFRPKSGRSRRLPRTPRDFRDEVAWLIGHPCRGAPAAARTKDSTSAPVSPKATAPTCGYQLSDLAALLPVFREVVLEDLLEPVEVRQRDLDD